MNPFVQIQNVSKTFKTKNSEFTAVKNINLTVSQGEFVAFIGHSGCGKSTVLNMIAGLSQPTSGKVLVEGREIKEPGADRAMVFQNYSLLPWLSVSGNVFQAVDSVYEKNLLKAEKRAMSDQFIDMVGLGKHKNKLPGQLSGGMKQRAAIARAFATKPEVLLLDEPFGALDALTKGALHDELLEIWEQSAQQGRKQTIFMVTHDIDEAIYLCDRVVVFTNGPGATIGEVIEVPIARPRDKRTMVHLSAYAEIKERLIDLLTVGALKARSHETGGRESVRVGFVPLTDCASVVMARELEMDFKHGITLEIIKETSWKAVRDKLLTGELDAAHCLWSLPLSVKAGITEPKGQTLPIAMTLSANGQAITLSGESFPIEYGDLSGLKEAVSLLRLQKGEPLTFAATYPGGTHDIWLRTTLDAAGVAPEDYRVITIPPPQMVLNLAMGHIEGFCAGEPWNALAVEKNAGWTFLATQDIWPNHPEKALVVSPHFLANHRDKLKSLIKALLETSAWLDDPKNRDRTAQKICAPQFVNTAYEVIKGRLMGDYNLGNEAGKRHFDADKMLFFDEGRINAPRLEHALWFFERFAQSGYELPEGFDEIAAANEIVLTEIFAEAASELVEDGFEMEFLDGDAAPIDMKLGRREMVAA